MVSSTRVRASAGRSAECVTAGSGCDLEIPFPRNWRGALGASVTDHSIRLRIAGAGDGPAVFVLGGISADRQVADEGAVRGWWSDVARSGGGVDTDRFTVIGADFFPLDPPHALALCPADYADIFAHALAAAGFDKVHAVIGASFGGAIALAFARRFPGRLGRLGVLCAADRPSGVSSAWRAVQANIIEFARAHGEGPAGVAIARQLAMTTYRTPEEFSERFGSRSDIAAYLTARGRDYMARMSAERYLTLSAGIDRVDEAPHEIDAPAAFIAADSDQLVPVATVKSCVQRYRGPAQFHVIASRYGHDAFLKDAAAVNAILSPFLKEHLDD